MKGNERKIRERVLRAAIEAPLQRVASQFVSRNSDELLNKCFLSQEIIVVNSDLSRCSKNDWFIAKLDKPIVVNSDYNKDIQVRTKGINGTYSQLVQWEQLRVVYVLWLVYMATNKG